MGVDEAGQQRRSAPVDDLGVRQGQAMLGALGGAVMAPKISVTLGIGVEVIVLAFAVVAIGGMGSIEGALIGATIVATTW